MFAKKKLQETIRLATETQLDNAKHLHLDIKYTRQMHYVLIREFVGGA